MDMHFIKKSNALQCMYTIKRMLLAFPQNHASQVLMVDTNCVSLIDWISDTRSQGCTDLQSLVKCLDHRGIVLDTVYACNQAGVVLGCTMQLCMLLCSPTHSISDLGFAVKGLCIMNKLACQEVHT